MIDAFDALDAARRLGRTRRPAPSSVPAPDVAAAADVVVVAGRGRPESTSLGPREATEPREAAASSRGGGARRAAFVGSLLALARGASGARPPGRSPSATSTLEAGGVLVRGDAAFLAAFASALRRLDRSPRFRLAWDAVARSGARPLVEAGATSEQHDGPGVRWNATVAMHGTDLPAAGEASRCLRQPPYLALAHEIVHLSHWLENCAATLARELLAHPWADDFEEARTLDAVAAIADELGEGEQPFTHHGRVVAVADVADPGACGSAPDGRAELARRFDAAGGEAGDGAELVERQIARDRYAAFFGLARRAALPARLTERVRELVYEARRTSEDVAAAVVAGAPASRYEPALRALAARAELDLRRIPSSLPCADEPRAARTSAP